MDYSYLNQTGFDSSCMDPAGLGNMPCSYGDLTSCSQMSQAAYRYTAAAASMARSYNPSGAAMGQLPHPAAAAAAGSQCAVMGARPHVQDVHRASMFPSTMNLQSASLESYDFIVVGSGSAGSVIANRLSENADWSVLLLEAGDVESQLFEIPMVVSIGAFSQYNWGYFMEYEPGIDRGFVDNLMPWPRGRALGGTSTINYMIYTRGHRVDFERWEQAGNPGWGYKDVLPYYIKSERSRLKHSQRKYHGHDGYLSVEDAYYSPITNAFIEGCEELGLPYSDYNSDLDPLCVSHLQATTLKGHRHSVARAFLQPIRNRPNLHIKTGAFVTKILIGDKKAYGVTYTQSFGVFNAFATKEVILSAGTFNSPQLLMLSGIGPKEHLEELEIPVIKNLPVGRNLQDHLTFLGLAFTVDGDVTLTLPQILNPKAWLQFFVDGTGPLQCIGGAQAIAYIKTKMSEEIQEVPDVELLFIGLSMAVDFGLLVAKGMGFRRDVFDSLLGPLDFRNAWMVYPVLLHPKSAGYLKLKSRNPHDYPLLHGNFFTDPHNHDINTLLASIRYVQKLAKTRAFQRYNSTLNPNQVPGCKQFLFDSDEYWRCCLRSVSGTLHHQVGTAKMGPKNDPTAVVSNKLKVHGIEGLRVADCSVIPFALGAHTNAPSIMVGEKASDFIKEYWLKNHATKQ